MRTLMLRAAALAAAAYAVAQVAGACQTLRRAPEPRPMTFACTASPAAFGARATALLREHGWLLAETSAPAEGRFEATRAPVYVGLGENLQVNGPYHMTGALAGGRATLIVHEVEVRGRRATPSRSLDERAQESDRVNFVPILDGLRQLCGAR